ncbi:MAG TPA: flagellar regulator YcgR PilZN domain-containing protein, partial [Kineobactrum sp.]
MSDDIIVTAAHELTSLLGTVHKQQLSVSILGETSASPEPSLLLAIGHQTRRLVFDAPRAINAPHFAIGKHITALTYKEGAELRFDVQIQTIANYRGYPALQTSWPERVIYRQRRKSFRVRLGKDESSRLDLYGDNGGLLRGQLLDISANGFGALIEKSAPLVVGELVDYSLEVGGISVSGKLEIRDLATPAQGRFMRIGVNLVKLEPTVQKQLERIARDLERRAM